MTSTLTNILTLYMLTLFYLQLNELRQRVIRLREVVQEDCPQYMHLLPEPEEISEDKFADCVFTADNCNQARKTKKIANTRVGGKAKDMDCHNHLRNTICATALEKALSRHLTVILQTSLDEIDPTLRVKTLMSSLCRAYDKEFSLAANYPKGHGKYFLGFIKQFYPGVLLYHVESMHGSRMDVIFSASIAMYMNRAYNVAFLEYCLSLRGEKRYNILQRNLYVELTSDEMVAQCRFYGIFFIAIIMPLRWLAGNTHTLQEYQWGARHMNRALDVFHRKIIMIEEVPKLFLSEMWMMSIFEEFRQKLPPFQDYLLYMFKVKKQKVVARKSGARLMPLSKPVRNCFIRRTKRTAYQHHVCWI